MVWWMLLLCFFVGVMLIMLAGVPVAISFIIVNFLIFMLKYGGLSGSTQLILSIYDSLSKFTLTPIPLFIFMGELLFRSGIVGSILNAISMWIGKVPGRLSLLSIGGGAIFANLCGSSVANTAVLGSLLVPEMQKHKYSRTMSFGPIMAGAGLAMILPPSTIAILMGGIGKISVAPLLIGGVLPGIMLAVFYMAYILIRSSLNPVLAPKYETESYSFGVKVKTTAKSSLPVMFIMFLVLGLIFMGIATPTESAALGTLGAFILLIIYRKCTKEVLKAALMGTLKLTGMIMFIVAGASGFSQLLSLTGAARQLIDYISGISVAPYLMVVIMLVIVFILGIFLEQIPIMMITLPVFMPIILAMHINPIWFGIVMLIKMHLGTYSPPFGIVLFVMKGVVADDVSMMDIYKSAIPFILLDILAIVALFVFPEIATYLPKKMHLL